MIKLEKIAEPEILTQNGAKWTLNITNKIAAGMEITDTEKTRYRHPQIKAALVAETSGKCAYCESKILHIHHGDVEHITPKSLEPELSVIWHNLTLACEICNQNKGARDPKVEHIMDPYNVDPSEHLTFAGALVLTTGSAQGIQTQAILDLNRGELAERRKERLESLLSIVEMTARTDIAVAARRAIYEDFKARELNRSTPYSAMANVFAEQVRPIVERLIA